MADNEVPIVVSYKTTGEEAAIQSVDKLTAAEEQAAKSADTHAKSQINLGNAIVVANQAMDLAGKVMQGVTTVYDALIGDTVKYAETVKNLALNLNLSAEETSKLVSVGEKFGVSTDTLTRELDMMVKRGMAPSLQGLEQLSDHIMSINDPVKRAAELSDIFGRNWTALLPILEKGSVAIGAAADEAERFGKVINEATTAQVEELRIEINTLNERLEGTKTKIGVQLMPDIVNISDQFARLANIIGGTETPLEYMNRELGYAITLFGENSDMAKKYRDAISSYEFALKSSTSATDASDRATRRNTEALAAQDKQLRMAQAGAEYLTDATDRAAKRQDDLAKSQAAATVVAQAAAAAEATHRSAVEASITAVDKMAQSLAKSTDAQAKQILAQSQLDTLKQAYDKGVISADQLKKATDQIMIAQGLATPKSIAMADAQNEVNKAMIDGKLPLDSYIADIDKIPKLANDGTISMKDLAALGIDPTTEATQKQTGVVHGLIEQWDHVPKNVTTTYTIKTVGSVPSGGTSSHTTPGHATGANFIVPPGYSNDSYPMRVSSGERVIVQPTTQNFNIYGGNQSPESIASAVSRKIGSSANSRQRMGI